MGSIHWVSAERSVEAEVRLFEPLFSSEVPDDLPDGADFLTGLNPASLEVLTGCHSHGQGHETTFAQLVSERLGIPIETVSVVHGDTDKVQFGMGTYGSRSGAVGMSAIVKALDKVVVAEILESVQHPNADRLSVCKVNDGSGHPRQIVCGAKNYKAGDKVPLALPGAVLPGDFKIKPGKLRGVESEGMMCSAKMPRSIPAPICTDSGA